MNPLKTEINLDFIHFISHGEHRVLRWERPDGDRSTDILLLF